MTRRKFASVLLLAGLASGCVNLSRSEQMTLRELKSYGIEADDQRRKSPLLAGSLNVLPGFGNFYLAVGTEEGTQWLYGGLNLLFWPLSVAWGVPQAAVDANAINKRETAFYYAFDPTGIEELNRIRIARNPPTASVTAILAPPPAAPAPVTTAAPTLTPAATASPAPSSMSALAPNAVSAVARKGANLRTQPNNAAPLVGSLSEGTSVALVSSTKNPSGVWRYVKVNGRTGWMLEADLEPALP